MIPHLVPEIEGGYPERDGGAEEEEEEEGQGLGDSRRLMSLVQSLFGIFTAQFKLSSTPILTSA